MQNVRRYSYFWAGVSLLLLITGLTADGIIGMALLAHPDRNVLIWHIPAAIAWALGVNFISLHNTRSFFADSLSEASLLCSQPERGLAAKQRWLAEYQDSNSSVGCLNTQPEATSTKNKGRRWMPYISWSGLVALFLGLGAFPGFGPLAYSLALIIGNFLRRPSAIETQEEIALQAGVPLIPIEISPSFEWSAQPLVEHLQTSDIETRRTAVAVLGRYGNPQTTQQLRQLLADPQGEIRADASVALSRLEDEFSRSLNLALEQWRANPSDNALALTLAEECYCYASSNVLDQSSQYFYLEHARDLLLQVVAHNSSNANLWLMLARVRARLNEPHQALQDAQVSLRLNPGSVEAALLAMELAFRLHIWDLLIALANRQTTILPDEAASLLWWEELKPELQKEAAHG